MSIMSNILTECNENTCNIMIFGVCGLIWTHIEDLTCIYYQTVDTKLEIEFHNFIWREFCQKSLMVYILVVSCNHSCWSLFHLWIVCDSYCFQVLVSTHENNRKQVAEHWPKNSFVLNKLWIIENCNISIDWVCLG